MSGTLDSASCFPAADVDIVPHGAGLDLRRGDIIRDLADIGPGDASLVGGKAFHLGALMRNGFHIPGGFCITTEAFRRSRITMRDEPVLLPPLRDLVVAAWRRTGLKVAAVRSSANEEDGSEASWAGVFPTVLPVYDEDEMIAAVESCFRALHAPGAELYRRSRRLGRQPPAMAVLVQDLVEARAAGMVFTANPVTGARDEIVINAVPGLGEPLASGLVNGDVFVTTRVGVIKTASLSVKPFMLTREGEVALAPAVGERPAVTAEEVEALARLAVQVEETFGCPQDIEFAIGGNRIYLIQARPITGPVEGVSIGEPEVELYLDEARARMKSRVQGLRRQGKLRGRDAIFSNGNVGELLPTPTPMSFGLFRAIFAGCGGAIVTGRRKLGYRLDDDAAEPLYELICGQPYFNVEIDAETFNIGLPIQMDSILASIVQQPSRANYPEFGLYTQGLRLDEALARYGAIEGKKRHDIFLRFHAAMVKAAHDMRRRYPKDVKPSLLRCLEPARPDEVLASNAHLLAAFQHRLDHLSRFACVRFVMAARIAFFFADMVRWRLERHLGDARLAAPLFQGLDGSMVTQQAFDLENLAQGLITRDAFLRAYGHGATNELEISLVRLVEDPGAIDQLLQELAVSGRRPATEFQEQQRRRRAVQRALRRQLTDHGLGEDEIRAFFADLCLAQGFLPLRETIKHYYTGEYRALREILLEINRRLGWEDGDIFYLEPGEIADCFRSRHALAPLVRRRRRERKIAALLAVQRRVPAVIFADRAQTVGTRPEGAVSGDLKGIPVAPGSAVGRVRLLDDAAIRSSSGKEMGGEQILVARSANLGLAPLLRVAAGLIVEVGGVLAHAACQARESGIPAVVLAGATHVLREGMVVSVDGQTGCVEILDARGAGR
jgi:pyruvate,water dikinase